MTVRGTLEKTNPRRQTHLCTRLRTALHWTRMPVPQVGFLFLCVAGPAADRRKTHRCEGHNMIGLSYSSSSLEGYGQACSDTEEAMY